MSDLAAHSDSSRSIVRGPGEGERIPLGEAGEVVLKAEGVETGGSLTIYEFTMPPATAGPPEHLHHTWDEAFIVLDGEMTFLIAGKTHLAPAGSVVFIPHGVLHTFWNASDSPARQITVFSPSGIEDYFRDVTRVLAAGTAEALDEAATLMEKHDMIVPANARTAYGALHPAPDTNRT
jgi:quercetin dioxygenase-like cupin family protein